MLKPGGNLGSFWFSFLFSLYSSALDHSATAPPLSDYLSYCLLYLVISRGHCFLAFLRVIFMGFRVYSRLDGHLHILVPSCSMPSCVMLTPQLLQTSSRSLATTTSRMSSGDTRPPTPTRPSPSWRSGRLVKLVLLYNLVLLSTK